MCGTSADELLIEACPVEEISWGVRNREGDQIFQSQSGLLDVQDPPDVPQGAECDCYIVHQGQVRFCPQEQVVQIANHGNPLLSQQGQKVRPRGSDTNY